MSSPFRRCLQTAGIVAKILRVKEVCVDNRLGEDMAQVVDDKMKIQKARSFHRDLLITRCKAGMLSRMTAT